MRNHLICAVLLLTPATILAQSQPLTHKLPVPDKAAVDVREKRLKEDRQKHDRTAKELARKLKAAGIDVDAYLAESKAFADAGPTDKSAAMADAINAKYAGPIRDALDKTTGIAGLGELLQKTQTADTVNIASEPATPLSGSLSCCRSITFEPPWNGVFIEGDLGATSVNPAPVTQLSPHVRSAIAWAPHSLHRSPRNITIPATARTVRVDVALDTSWVIGLSGLGYARVWLGMKMDVVTPSGAVVCAAPHLEQDNQWTLAGGFLTLSDRRPGPRITRSCTFTRTAGDPTNLQARVAASVDGTFFGASGGYGYYFVNLGTVTVTYCE